MMQAVAFRNAATRQQGVTLLTGLVLLAALSLLALVATSSMLLQLRMAGNFEDSRLALQNSAMAVAEGERFLYSIRNDARLPDCRVNCFTPPLDAIIHAEKDIPVFAEYENENWWHSWAVDAVFDPLSGAPVEAAPVMGANPPRFLIEELYFDPLTSLHVAAGAPLLSGIAYYRILGRGCGKGASTVAVSESIIARPWKVGATAVSGPGSSGRDSSEFCAGFRPWYDCGRKAWRQRR